MKTVVFFREIMIMGGAETLVLRLMKWYSEHSYRIILLTLKEISDSTIINDLSEISNGECYVFSNERVFQDRNKRSLYFKENEEVTVISDQIYSFFKISNLLSKRIYKCNFHHRLYIVHPNFTKTFDRKLNSLGKLLITRLLRKEILVFMDEETRDACIQHYSLVDSEAKFEILRLPMELNDKVKSVYRKDKFHVLSISRFEFPFKGYILGLIEAFETVKSQKNDIEMTIIGYGEGLERVEKKIKELPESTQSSIRLVGKTEYSIIDEYISQCDLFVGMGTTMLDAANYNKICIIPVAYQESELTVGYFHDNFNPKPCFNSCDVASYFNISDLILEVINYSSEKFIQKCDKAKEILNKHYNINAIAPKLIKESLILSVGDKLLIKFCYKLIKMYAKFIHFLNTK